MQKVISIFLNSAGALLLAMASTIFLINLTSLPDLVQPHDPVFFMPLDEILRIVAVITAITALVCFFSEHITLPAYLLLWLAFSYFVYRVSLYFESCYSLTGYLGSFSIAFGISANATNILLDMIFTYFLVGSCSVLWLARQIPQRADLEKMSCPSCGGHVKFDTQNLGQQIACPHCKAVVKLRKHEELMKTSCFFCGEHIAFPAHALGRKVKCPHCKMEIGLRESA